MTTSAHVYRCYSEDGRLIYIGCTTNLWNRLDTHRSSTWWAHMVANVKAELHPTIADARHAEGVAIREENPRFNVMGRWSRRSLWTAGDYADFIQAIRLGPTGDRSDHNRRLLARAEAELTRRYGKAAA